MSEIHKIEKNGVTIYPATTTDAVVDKNLRVASSKLIEEVNVSKIYPTGGIDGTNKYTLETAIAMIPTSLRTVGIKCSFINEANQLETWEYNGEGFTNMDKWFQIGTRKISSLEVKDGVYTCDSILLNKNYECVFNAIKRIRLLSSTIPKYQYLNIYIFSRVVDGANRMEIRDENDILIFEFPFKDTEVGVEKLRSGSANNDGSYMELIIDFSQVPENKIYINGGKSLKFDIAKIWNAEQLDIDRLDNNFWKKSINEISGVYSKNKLCSGTKVDGLVYNISAQKIKIDDVTNYGAYKYAVEGGKKYIIDGTMSISNLYAAIYFTTKESLSENDIINNFIAGNPEEPDFNYEFSPSENGYLYLTFFSGTSLSLYNAIANRIPVIENKVEKLQSEGEENSQAISVLSNNFLIEQSVRTLNEEGSIKGYISKKGVVSAFENSNIFYYAIEKGKKYRISLIKWHFYNVYYTVSFSTKIPEIGDTVTGIYMHDTTGNYDITIEYKADETGYLLLGRWSGTSAIEELELTVKEISADFNIIPKPKRNIICSGSSITWGDGNIDGSMVGFVDKYIKENLSVTLMPNDLTYSVEQEEFRNNLQYLGVGKKISGVGAKVEFVMYGDEIAICQTKLRTTDYGIMRVKANEEIIGIFDNHNEIYSDYEYFTGENIVNVRLKHPCTFNHSITINGSIIVDNIVIATKVSQDIGDEQAMVYRGLDNNGKPVHFIKFNSSLGTITSVSVSYQYGRIITHERSTVGQLNDGVTNESYFGSGTVSYDPDNPTGGVSSGMEFRAIDERAFYVYKFDTPSKRKFEIEIIEGNNPYFIINYVTNRFNNLMNAGIGGWGLSNLIDKNKINDFTQFFKWFTPDIVFQESGTNDDWLQDIRRIRRNVGKISKEDLLRMPTLELYSVTYDSNENKYEVISVNGVINAIDEFSLSSTDIIGTKTQVGDIVRIGNYYGDNKQVVCRKISEVNIEEGIIKWEEPINADNILNIDKLEDLIGASINIRNLDSYKSKYKQFIEKFRAIAPQAKLVIVGTGLSMYGIRQLWGYDIVHRDLCNEYKNVQYCNISDWIYDGIQKHISGNSSETIEATGALEYELEKQGKNGGWQGFKVLVNNIDVYGKDCYIDTGSYYHQDKNKDGDQLDKTGTYYHANASWQQPYPMKLVFFRNAPQSGNIIIQYSDDTWSHDYCHPEDYGKYLYGQMYANFL